MTLLLSKTGVLGSDPSDLLRSNTLAMLSKMAGIEALDFRGSCDEAERVDDRVGEVARKLD